MKQMKNKKPKLPRNRHAANLPPNKVIADKRPRKMHEALDLEWKEGMEPRGEW